MSSSTLPSRSATAADVAVDPASLGGSRRFVGGAMLAAPLLMAVGATFFVAGVGVTPEPFDDGSWIEGVVGVFALAAFVPVYLALANRLSVYRPRLAAVARVTGLVGAVTGVVWESLRVFSQGLVESGMTPEQAQRFLDEQLAYSWPLTVSVLFPLTSVLLGLALAGRGLPRWQGLALAGGGLGFVTGQALMVAIDITYPVGAALWVMALVPLGIEVLRHNVAPSVITVEGRRATAAAA
jgi:hypothetical protein